ncbi:hypothetical protein PIB30_047060 [Stylosanthes scabra]|uniref:Uncharacterized protein n=1 Tax=Stylosanthes scabra TaxID=79078 RepID=A0ABU6UGV8_9FABA|nr:hypothetical protein [Stylosanthes scabra]
MESQGTSCGTCKAHIANEQFSLRKIVQSTRFDVIMAVNPIVDDVRTRGNAAVKEYLWKFEKAKLDKVVEIVSELPDPVKQKNVWKEGGAVDESLSTLVKVKTRYKDVDYISTYEPLIFEEAKVSDH